MGGGDAGFVAVLVGLIVLRPGGSDRGEDPLGLDGDPITATVIAGGTPMIFFYDFERSTPLLLLLLAGVVIGSLGVLDDVTVTQVSAVWEL